MKKKINKKLSLVKQTVTSLNESGLNKAKGGMPPWTEWEEADYWFYIGTRNSCACLTDINC
jgi:hypothetical protein